MTGPKSPSPRDGQVVSEEGDTRRRLLDAAIEIASTEGLDKVTYRSVARKVGLSHSLVRFYFGTGDAMRGEALETWAKMDIDDSQIRATTIEEFGAEIMQLMTGDRARAMLQFDYLLRSVDGTYPIESMQRVYDLYIGGVSQTLADLEINDPQGATAALVFAAIDGLILQHAVYGSDERTEQSMDQLRRILRLLRSAGPGET